MSPSFLLVGTASPIFSDRVSSGRQEVETIEVEDISVIEAGRPELVFGRKFFLLLQSK